MLLQALALVAACLSAGESREFLKPAPSISNSLVNLGKIDISFYLNGRDPLKLDYASQPPASFFVPKSEPVSDEPCPCSSLRNIKDTLFGNPSGILNKLLMNNNLFSSNKDPVASTLCCESHEHIEEGTVLFEFPPNRKPQKPALPKLPFLPFIFDNIAPKNTALPSWKTKAIEIFMFPKKKEDSIDFSKLQRKKEMNYKDGIQIVGDKDIKKSFVSVPTSPLPARIDTTQVEKNVNEKENDLIVNVDGGIKLNAV